MKIENRLLSCVPLILLPLLSSCEPIYAIVRNDSGSVVFLSVQQSDGSIFHISLRPDELFINRSKDDVIRDVKVENSSLEVVFQKQHYKNGEYLIKKRSGR